MDEIIIITIVIAIGIILITIFGYMFLDAMKLRRLRKKYNEDDDLSKKGEGRRFVDGGTSSYRGASYPARTVLENDDTPRAKKNSNSPRGIFKTLYPKG